MTAGKTLVATAVLAIITATSASAQEPAAFQSMYPNRDVLNGGALTPAGRMGLEEAGGAVSSPRAFTGVVAPIAAPEPVSQARRRSYRHRRN